MQTVNLLHRSEDLHKDAGTFYHRIYEDAGRVGTLFDSYSWANQLLLEEALDAAKLFVRTAMPIVHRDLFLPIRISERVYREGAEKMITYGDGTARYGDFKYYGHPAIAITGGIDLPPGVLSAELCCELPVDPSIVLFPEEHFVIRDGTLFFTIDPFEVFPIHEELHSDRSIVIYLRGVSVDRQYVQDRLGVLLQTRGESTQIYKDFNNLAMDCVMEGTSRHRLTRLLCKLFDVPCSSSEETVEREIVTKQWKFLVTDKAVYPAPLAANFLYSSGEMVKPGTILSDGIVPVTSNSFTEKSLNKLPLLLERRFLGKNYSAGLIFPNEEVKLQWLPKWKSPGFPIIGRPEDVDSFWSMFHARGLLREAFPDMMLGGHTNPAQFLYNILYPRALFYTAYLDKCGVRRLPTVNSRVFRELVPPGVLFSLMLVSPKECFEPELPPFDCVNSKWYSTCPSVSTSFNLTVTDYFAAQC